MTKDHDTLAREQVQGIGLCTSEPSFLSDPLYDRMLETIISLGGELWIERDRRRILESVLASKGLVASAELEAHTLDVQAAADRDAELQAMVERLLGPLKTLGGADA